MNSSRETEYILMWDMYGLETIINVTEIQDDAIIAGLKGEEFKHKNPLHYMILRARFNSQRCYEIYSIVTKDIDKDDFIRLFKDSPQMIVDLIRERGTKIYSDRKSREAVIT